MRKHASDAIARRRASSLASPPGYYGLGSAESVTSLGEFRYEKMMRPKC